jgi:hypothetical protein
VLRAQTEMLHRRPMRRGAIFVRALPHAKVLVLVGMPLAACPNSAESQAKEADHS